MRHISIRLSEDHFNRIKETGKSPTRVVREALDNYFGILRPEERAFHEVLDEHVREYHKHVVHKDDHKDDEQTWTYASDNSVTAQADLTDSLSAGMIIKLVQGVNIKFFRIESVVYVDPTTTITLNGGGIFTVADTAIDSHMETFGAAAYGVPREILRATEDTPGYMPGLTNDGTTFLRDDGTWALPGGKGYLTVGPHNWCDYVTDGAADDVQINAALASFGGKAGTVLLDCDATFDMTDDIDMPQRTALMSISVAYSDHFLGDVPTLSISRAHKNISVKMNSSTRLSGIRFYYPDQVKHTAPPEVYAPSIVAAGNPACDIEIDHIHFVNSYIAFDSTLETWPGGFATSSIHDCSGYPLYIGFRLGRSGDFTEYYNNRFGAAGYPDCCYHDPYPNDLSNWVKANGRVFVAEYDYEDSSYNLEASHFINNFAFEYFSLISILNNSVSTSVGITLIGNHSDSCGNAIEMHKCGGVTALGNVFYGTGENSFNRVEGIISGNHFHGDDDGIHFVDCTNLQSLGNQIHATGNRGMLFGSCSHITCVGNGIDAEPPIYEGLYGIYWDADCHDFTCADNEISNLATGGKSIVIEAGADNFTIHDNRSSFPISNLAGTSSTKLEHDNCDVSIVEGIFALNELVYTDANDKCFIKKHFQKDYVGNLALDQISAHSPRLVYGHDSSNAGYVWNGAAWYGLSGSLLKIGVGIDESLFIIGTDNGLYKWVSGSWSSCGGVITQFAVLDATHVYAIGSGYLYFYNGSGWTQLDNLTQISYLSVARDGSLFAITTINSNLVKWSGSAWGASLGGTLTAIAAVNGSFVWAIESDSLCYYDGASWVDTNLEVSSISVMNGMD